MSNEVKANTKPTAADAAKLEEQKKAKSEASKRWKEKKQQQAAERVESAKAMIGRLEKSGIFAKLDPVDQAFLKGLAEPKSAAASGNTGLFTVIFPNAKVGDSITLDEVFAKTLKGKSNLDHYVKKWAEKGIIVEYKENKADIRKSTYSIVKM
jgi:hypothetical protein